MKLCLYTLLLIACLSTLSAQTMLERIHEIQSFEDFKRIAIEHKQMAEVMLEARARSARGQVGEKSTSLRTQIRGKKDPELFSVLTLIALAIPGDHYKHLSRDLLKRGFPEDDLPILKTFMNSDKDERQKDLQRLYRRFQKEMLSGTVFAGQDMSKFDWKSYRTLLEDPKQSEQAREEIRTFLFARHSAGKKASNQLILDRLRPFSAQALRAIIKFCYEERVEHTSGSYAPNVITDEDLDFFIEFIVYK